MYACVCIDDSDHTITKNKKKERERKKSAWERVSEATLNFAFYSCMCSCFPCFINIINNHIINNKILTSLKAQIKNDWEGFWEKQRTDVMGWVSREYYPYLLFYLFYIFNKFILYWDLVSQWKHSLRKVMSVFSALLLSFKMILFWYLTVKPTSNWV